MQQWLTFGSSYIFIQSWTTDTISGVSTAVVCSVVLVVIMTSTKYFIQYISHRYTDPHYRSNKGKHLWLWGHVLCSATYTVQVSSSYLLMLCVMSYDGWIILSVVLAAGFTYLLLQPAMVQLLNRRQKTQTKSSDNTPLHHRGIRTKFSTTESSS